VKQIAVEGMGACKGTNLTSIRRKLFKCLFNKGENAFYGMVGRIHGYNHWLKVLS